MSGRRVAAYRLVGIRLPGGTSACAALVAMLLAGTVGPSAAAAAGTATEAASAPADVTAAPSLPGVVLVGFQPGVSAADRTKTLAGVGGLETRVVGMGAHVVSVGSGSVGTAIAALRRNPLVRYAEPDFLLRPLSNPAGPTPNDPYFAQDWALRNTGQTVNGVPATAGDDVNVVPEWATTTDARSAVIGLVDDTFDYTDPDLAGSAWNNPGGVGGCPAGTHGYDVATNTCNPGTSTGAGHGSAMASTAGAVGNNATQRTGVAWSSSILGVSTDNNSDTATFVAGLAWVRQAKQSGVNVRVINASWGSYGNPSQAEADEIAADGANGILVVAASGNGRSSSSVAGVGTGPVVGVDNDTTPVYPCAYALSTVLCVTAVDEHFNLPSWSNYGGHTVDLAAPGEHLCGPIGGTCSVSGTSYSTAYVSGAAALLAAVHPDWTVGQLRAAIVDDVRPAPALAGKTRTGGVLDVYCAMTLCRAPTPTPSPALTESSSPSPTPSATSSPTPTASASPTSSPTPSATLTQTPSSSPTATTTPTPSVTASSTPSAPDSSTPSPTSTATASSTPAVTPTPSAPVVWGVVASAPSPSDSSSVVTGWVSQGSAVALSASDGVSSVTGDAVVAADGSFRGIVDVSGLLDGPVTVIVTATDAAGQVGRGSTSFQKCSAPGVVDAPAVTSKDRAVSLSFAAPLQVGGCALTGFRVRSLPAGLDVIVTSSPVTLWGLTNGTGYAFTVAAVNEAGFTSPDSPASAVVVPKGTSVLSQDAGPGRVVQSRVVVLSGQLRRSDPSSLPGPVLVRMRDDVGTSRVLTSLTPDSTGRVWFSYRPVHNQTYTLTYSGDEVNRPAVSTIRRVLVAPRISVHAPPGPASTPQVITGVVTPNKPGTVLTLSWIRSDGSLRPWASTRIRPDGSYTLTTHFPRGTHTLQLSLPATPGNSPGTIPFTGTRT